MSFNIIDMRNYVRAYVSRTDLDNTLFDTWQSIAGQRLQRDLSLLLLDKYVRIANPIGDSILVWDISNFTGFMNELLSASVIWNGKPIPLKKVSWEEFLYYQSLTNDMSVPQVYTMFQNSNIKVAPGNQLDHTFDFYYKGIADQPTEQEGPVTGGFGELLNFAKGLYIDAVLIEVYKYLRDAEGEQLASARYDTEVERYNKFYEWQHSGANPSANTGAWQWH